MKKQITIFSFFALIICSNLAFSQLSFGVHTGYGTKSAYLGYKNKTHFMPYFSLQMANLRANTEFEDENELVKIGIVMPTIGTKYYLKDNGKLKPYFDLTVSKPVFYIKPVEEIENLKLLAGSLGFGTEYFLDPQFSIGGEFGLNILNARYIESYEDFDYNNYTSVEKEDKYKFTSNPTYGRISVNFYFEKRK
ncbi:MAG: hypothetical protein IPH28_17735 [Cytophagaceae bacterium]|nr:hypothetical protein [Cytophagaceae bacterium]